MAIPFGGGTSWPGLGGGGILPFPDPDAPLVADDVEGVTLGGAAGGGGMLGPSAGLMEATGGQGNCCWCAVPERSRVLSSLLRLCLLVDGPAESSFSSFSPSDSSPSTFIGRGWLNAGIGRFRTRMSLRIRILIPWSASEHDRGVDSDEVH